MANPENPQPNLNPADYAQMAVLSLKTLLKNNTLTTNEEFEDAFLLLFVYRHQVEQQGVPPEDPSLAIINALIRKLEIYQNENSNEF
jgi:NaMN:DMB phosphoribosyltransferase